MPKAPAYQPDLEASSSSAPTSTSCTRAFLANKALLGTLDRYTLVAPLGRGGVAEVFLAAWQVAPGMRRPVVIKQLNEHFGEDPAILHRFIDEARLVCLLEHDNIVRIHQVGVIDGQCSIVMEYLAGQSLHRLMRRSSNCGGIPIDLAAYICTRVLSALDYAHHAEDHHGRALGIVHRAISPHSIFVTNSGVVKRAGDSGRSWSRYLSGVRLDSVETSDVAPNLRQDRRFIELATRGICRAARQSG